MTEKTSPGILFGKYFSTLNREISETFNGKIKAEGLRVYLEQQLKDLESVLHSEVDSGGIQISRTPVDLTLLLLTACLKLEEEIFKAKNVPSSVDLQKHRLQCIQTFVREALKSLPAAVEKTTEPES